MGNPAKQEQSRLGGTFFIAYPFDLSFKILTKICPKVIYQRGFFYIANVP